LRGSATDDGKGEKECEGDHSGPNGGKRFHT
jgi:hypothetical protein